MQEQQQPEGASSSPGPAPHCNTLPRITIKFCTQCRWMLRAAYFAQELLSTFSASIGEVALQPSTGGVFIVQIQTRSSNSGNDTIATPAAGGDDDPSPPPPAIRTLTLWDRKADGGFPETKELKRRVRDVIQPGRDLGHVDKDHHHRRQEAGGASEAQASSSESHAGGSSGSGSGVGSAEKGETETTAPAPPHHGLGGIMPLAPPPQPPIEPASPAPPGGGATERQSSGAEGKCEDCA